MSLAAKIRGAEVEGPLNVYEPSTINRWRGGGTRIFSPLAVAGLCVTIGRYRYLFKRLTAVSAVRFYRFEQIVAYSSFKAHAKQPILKSARFFPAGRTCTFHWTQRAQAGPALTLQAAFADINIAKTGPILKLGSST